MYSSAVLVALFLLDLYQVAISVVSCSRDTTPAVVVSRATELWKDSVDESEPTRDKQPSLDSVDWIGMCMSTSNINYGNTREFTFNKIFAQNSHAKRPLLTASNLNVDELRANMMELEGHSLNGTLTNQNKSDWQSLANQLIYSYGNESAGVAYQESTELWITCGWIELNDTNINADFATRMCASLLSLGISPPDRMPIEGKDFIPLNSSSVATVAKESFRKGSHKDKFSSRTPHPFRDNFGYSAEEETLVDLFANEEDDSCTFRSAEILLFSYTRGEEGMSLIH